MNRSEAGKLGAVISSKKIREEALKRYYQNPSVCKYCGEIINVPDGIRPSLIKRKKFCNHSCSGKFYSNKYKKIMKSKYCINCGIELHRGKKYCSGSCQQKYEWILRVNEYDKLEDFEGIHSQALRKYLIYKNGYKCSICGNEKWNGKDIPIIIDHIDGNSYNNKRNNLRLICPNCDAQLPTYKGRNYGNGRRLRRKRYKQDNLKKKKKLLCSECGKKIWKTGKTGLCRDCWKVKSIYSNRKVKDRPSKEEIQKMVDDKGYMAVGRIYGVSGNAVKKWLS